jgi:adenosylmethionine-8-amino-7-oxononanoate aminotransferase
VSEPGVDDGDALFTLDPRRHYPTLVGGEGCHVWDDQGHRYLDAIAGIAVVNLGYGRTDVVRAIAAQATALPFAVSNIFGNRPAQELAARIAALTPGDLDHVHFTSGGSEAVEVALKMARQYHVVRGEPDRTVFISRWTSYHGATLGALTVGGSRLRRRAYQPLLMDTPHIPVVNSYRHGGSQSFADSGEWYAAQLESAILEAGPGNVAAFIAEPIVASVGGTLAPPDDYFPLVREICDRYGVLLIIDEVVTGFGRTGRTFAVDHWGVVPDLMAMGKGISGGYAPLGAVAARSHVRQVFTDAGATFEHIFTFGGNPVSMAAGVAVLDAWRDEDVLGNVARVSGPFAAALEPLQRFPFVGDIRVRGLMAGIEFVADRGTKEPFEPGIGFGGRIRDAGLRNGVVTYPGSGVADGLRGDIISLYPPLVISPTELQELSERLQATFEEVAAGLA